MSRVNDFDDVYVDSRGRLLLQLYAYAGDAPAAEDALDEAFINASRHWHRLSTAQNRDSWLRDRAVRRLDARPRAGPRAGTAAQVTELDADPTGRVTSGLTRASPANARLLSALAALDATSRRLLIVRRLDGVDLASAAREVGLTDGAAEQALARATSALHGNGVDTTPTGLLAALVGLGDDLRGRPSPLPGSIRRSGTRRRVAFTLSLGVALVAVAAGAGALSAASPLSTPSATGPTPPVTSPPPSTPRPSLNGRSLLTAEQVSVVAGGGDAAWNVTPSTSTPPNTSVYGACVQAADNPPPDTRWIRDFDGPGKAAASHLRQVLQLAPSEAEATRSFQQIVDGFTLCTGHQLVGFSDVASLGQRTKVVDLRLPSTDGPVTEYVVVAQSGPAVTFLSAVSSPTRPSDVTTSELVELAGNSVNEVCTETTSPCAFPPYDMTAERPPSDGVSGEFLSVVDLPVVANIAKPWAGTDPTKVTRNPSATACDQADFAAGGARRVMSRSYVIPDQPGLPTVFGLSETVGTFRSGAAAKAFISQVATHVAGCHKRQLTLSVAASTTFTAARTNGDVWKVLQKTSKTTTLTLRVALVRYGDVVAQVTFTPAGVNDVSQPEFVALARRAAIRLAD